MLDARVYDTAREKNCTSVPYTSDHTPKPFSAKRREVVAPQRLQNTSMTDLVVSMLNHFVVPKKCTLKKAYIISTVQGTIASTEGSTLTLRKNNSTDTLITDAIMCACEFERILISDLNIAFKDQDYFELLWKTPAWVTNPTAVRLTIVLYFE